MSLDVIKKSEDKMKAVIEAENREFAGIRTGRANPSILDRVTVDYYDTPTPLAQVATISVPEPKMIIVTPWDKSLLQKIEKAISKSDVGLVPANDGTVIRLAIPHLTEERRKELVKLAKKIAEEMRVAVRNIRRDVNEELKTMEKSSEITEDDLKRAQDEVQKLTDKYISEVDKHLTAKENEIMQV